MTTRRKLRETANPVGLKGVIRFLKDRKEFDLKLRLYHGYNSKKNPQTNGFDPFYKPSGVLIQRGTWDINLSIPVVVFWSREEFVDVEPGGRCEPDRGG